LYSVILALSVILLDVDAIGVAIVQLISFVAASSN